MPGRLLVVGVVWLAAIGLFAALLQWSAPAPRRVTRAQHAASSLVRALNSMAIPSGDSPEWAVTRATSAHQAMVIDVDAEHPEKAREIAVEIVAPLRDRYEEVLIYVRDVDAARDATVRRIQWTPRGGYIEAAWEDDSR